MNVVVAAHAACLPATDGDVPSDAAWFDVRERLGRRGYRQLPLPAQLTLAAVRGLQPSGGEPPPADDVPGHRRGLWLGSSTAAAHCLAELDRQILDGGTASLPPTGAPYFSVNLVPSRAANELGATGPSVTVTSAGTATLDAVGCAVRALRLGQVDEAVVVAVEVPGPADGAPGRSECGAVALRLRRGTGAGLRSASAFAAQDPDRATGRVRDVLGLSPTDPVASSPPLAALARLARAVDARGDVAVVVTDVSGATTGVRLEHPSPDPVQTDLSRSVAA